MVESRRRAAYDISQNVQIVVEHYRENVQPLLDGKAGGPPGHEQAGAGFAAGPR